MSLIKCFWPPFELLPSTLLVMLLSRNASQRTTRIPTCLEVEHRRTVGERVLRFARGDAEVFVQLTGLAQKHGTLSEFQGRKAFQRPYASVPQKQLQVQEVCCSQPMLQSVRKIVVRLRNVGVLSIAVSVRVLRWHVLHSATRKQSYSLDSRWLRGVCWVISRSPRTATAATLDF